MQRPGPLEAVKVDADAEVVRVCVPHAHEGAGRDEPQTEWVTLRNYALRKHNPGSSSAARSSVKPRRGVCGGARGLRGMEAC